MTKPIAIYTRVSTTEQAISGLGLAAQAGACSRYCDLVFNGQERRSFEEHASARSLASRPILSAILNHAADFHALVVLRLDRLARNTIEFLQILTRLRAAGCNLHSVQERLDTDSPAGKVMTTIIAAFAEYERDLIGSRTRDAMAQAKSRGTHCGRPPFGFVASPLRANTQLLPLAKKVRDLSLARLSTYQIARLTGLPHSTVRYIARNPIYDERR